jgi:hypothetical protein
MAYTIADSEGRIIDECLPGEAFSAGELVAIHTDGKLYKANAITGGTQQMPCAGIAQLAATAADVTAAVKRIAVIRRTKLFGFSSLTKGGTVFVAESDGAITQTRPVTSGDIVQACGVAISDTEVMFDIGNGYWEVVP